MKIGVNLSINVSKIDKTKLFDGKKGKYLDCTVFIDTDNPDKYGKNGAISQAVSKEEREAGTKGEILGNCIVFWQGSSQDRPASKPDAHPNACAGVPDFDSEIPFADPYRFNSLVV